MPVMQAPAAKTRSYTPSAETLRVALSAAQAGIWEWHLDDDHNDWSEGLWALYGVPPDAPASFDNWLNSIHPEDRAQTRQAVTSASQRGESFEIEWRTHPANGEVRWLMSRGRPAPARKGRGSYTGVVTDITDRKRAEHAVRDINSRLEARVEERSAEVLEHERLLQTILDGIPGLVGYWTVDLRNRFANKAYSEWFGCRPEDIRNCHIQDVLGPDLFARNKPYMEGALAGVRQRFERKIPVPGRPGQHRHSEAHYIPDVHDGQVRGFLVMVFDISQVKQAEMAAEAANLAKSDFLANISHEVRTPLNAMFGLAQVGARQAQGTPSQRTFEQVLESAQHLLALVNDVLDFSRIEAGKLCLHHERINLAQVLEHVLSLKAIRAQAKGLQFKVLEGPTVPQHCTGDATRLSQILLNLLSNAIRYTERGEVCLRIDVQGPHLLMEVSDTGVGMGPEQLRQLFKPFVQLHGPLSVRQGGTGLGLAITRRLVELMDGHIDVHSEAQQGSTFTVKLPLHGTEAGDFVPLRNVTLVGLESEQRESLRQALSLHGAQVQCLQNLEQADAELPSGLIVMSQAALQVCDEARLHAHVMAGHPVLLNSPAGVAVHLPESMHNDLLVLAGPLTPLRLLNAVSRQYQRASHAASSKRLRGLRILAAEDNPINRLVLEQMLEQEGAEVTFANDGAQALEHVRLQGPDAFDLVLCDIQMPVMDGYETTHALNHIAPTLPVVGLTAHAFSSAKQQARQAGMVGYVTKPYMLDTLIQAIRQHARRLAPSEAPPPVNPHVAESQPAPVNQGLPDTSDCVAGAKDFEAMQRYFKAQPQLLDRLIGMLNRTLGEVETELARSLQELDMACLAKVAHNIKGTALNLHTPELARLAIQTQDEARAASAEAWSSAEDLLYCLQAFVAQASRHQAG
jgi:PAS domain S-box-containing protein